MRWGIRGAALGMACVLSCSSASNEPRDHEARAADGAARTPPEKAPPAKTTTAIADAAVAKAASSDARQASMPAKVAAAKGAGARRQFLRALNEGRAAMEGGESSRAVEAFERALAMRPIDPVGLCEAGWAHFQAGDLDRAADRLGKAIGGLEAARGTQEPRTLAACLYNLGRVEEQRGHRDEALARYRRSLALRPNDAVRTRLAALEATAPTKLPSAAPPPGPPIFPDLVAAVRNGDDYPGANQVARDDELVGEGTFTIARSAGPAGPLLAVAEVHIYSGGNQSCSFASLYAHTRAGWLVVAGGLGNWCEVDHGSGSDGLEVLSLDVRELPSGRALVAIVYGTSGGGPRDLVARADARREYSHSITRLVVYEVTERQAVQVDALILDARVSSARTSERCMDEAYEAGEQEGMPGYGVELIHCYSDERTDVSWSTEVHWNGAVATVTAQGGTPPAGLVGAHDFAAAPRHL